MKFDKTFLVIVTALIFIGFLMVQHSSDVKKDKINTDKQNENKILYKEAFEYEKNLEYEKAVELYKKILENSTNDSMFESQIQEHLDFCQNILVKIENYKKHDVGDYISDIKNYCIWDEPKKLKIYINPNDINYKIFKEAFEIWDKSARNFINFYYVNSSDEADITCETVKKYRYEKSVEIGTVGLTTTLSYRHPRRPRINYCSISTIEILEKNPYTHEAPSDIEIKETLLHEIAHALGLRDHSKHEGDILYYSTQSHYFRHGELSNRDINTLKKLYGNI